MFHLLMLLAAIPTFVRCGTVSENNTLIPGWGIYCATLDDEDVEIAFPNTPTQTNTSTLITLEATEDDVTFTFTANYPPKEVKESKRNAFLNNELAEASKAPNTLAWALPGVSLIFQAGVYSGALQWTLSYTTINQTVNPVTVRRHRTTITPRNIYTVQADFVQNNGSSIPFYPGFRDSLTVNPK